MATTRRSTRRAAGTAALAALALVCVGPRADHDSVLTDATSRPQAASTAPSTPRASAASRVEAVSRGYVRLPVIAPATPAPPRTLDEVIARLDALGHQSAHINEQLKQVRADLAAKQRTLVSARAAAAKARADYERASTALSVLLVNQYRQAPFSQAAALLTSPDSANYLRRLGVLEMLSAQRADVAAALLRARDAAGRAEASAATAAAAAARTRADLAAKQATLARQTAAFETQLRSLTADQRAAYTNRMNPLSPAEVAAFVAGVRAPNAKAQAAVMFALAQVGKPYVFASAGPDSFDCSGLTLAAWRQGGVALPHLASAQFQMGTPVEKDGLRPGDLIFLYDDLGHVMIYAGNGLVVNAPQPGDVVQVVALDRFIGDWAGARRYA